MGLNGGKDDFLNKPKTTNGLPPAELYEKCAGPAEEAPQLQREEREEQLAFFKPCLRSDGSERGWWTTAEEAAAFRDTHPAYFGDIVVLCGHCGLFHCSNPNWNVSCPWEVPVERLKIN